MDSDRDLRRAGPDPAVRIVVLSGDTEGETSQALRGLGPGFEIIFASDAHSALAFVARRDVDLVVLDDGADETGAAVLRGLKGDGPPALAVCRGDRDAQAVTAFDLGAADCVRHGDDFEHVLPAVALEQIGRFRQERERGDVESRIEWLERVNDAIVTAIPAALAVIDDRDRLVSINPEFARSFEVEPSEARGRRFADVLPEELVRTGEIGLLLAESAARREASPRLARCSDGLRQRIFDARARRLDDEGRLLLVLSDVTDRERMSRRIGELRKYNENIIQNMNSALMVIDRSGKIHFANATAEEILGGPHDGLQGRSAWDWFGPGDRERALIVRTLEDGVRSKGAETVIRRPDGTLVPVGISCAPLTDSRGRRGAVAIFQDLTEIKQLQRQVLQTEKMASIGQLAAGVAHEINNPMGFIHANLFQMSEYLGDLRKVWEKVEGLVKVASDGGSEETREAAAALESIARELDVDFVLGDFAKAIRESQEGSERIRHIVQDLRDFSYQDTAERVPSDINQCVDSTASIVWTMMKHSVVLEKEYRELPPVECFPMQLKQVFMNLLVNAYQAIEERVGSSGETGEIWIRTGREEDGVVVSIRDTGVGIPAEDLPRIFDPFFTTKEVGAGTGLGLSTSFSIVRRHGGTIRVDSVPGEGTTFEVRLPLSGPEPETVEREDDD